MGVHAADDLAGLGFVASHSSLEKKIDTSLDEASVCVACCLTFKGAIQQVKGAPNKAVAKQLIRDTKKKADNTSTKVLSAVTQFLNDAVQFINA